MAKKMNISSKVAGSTPKKSAKKITPELALENLIGRLQTSAAGKVLAEKMQPIDRETVWNSEGATGSYRSGSVDTSGKPKHRTSDAAEQEGRRVFRSWANSIRINWESVYEPYRERSLFLEEKDNFFHNHCVAATEYLAHLQLAVDQTCKDLGINPPISIRTRIRVAPDPLKAMNDEDSEDLYDPYDNETFVDSKETKEMVKGFWGSFDWEERYYYHIRHARDEQRKDVEAALEASSKRYFDDYYTKKYVRYPGLVAAAVAEELKRGLKEFTAQAKKVSASQPLGESADLDSLKQELATRESLLKLVTDHQPDFTS